LLTSRWTGVLIALAATLVYLVVGPVQGGLDSHLPVAQAFLAGRLHLVAEYSWLELVPRPEGGWYSPFPPLISLLMVPFVAIGLAPDTGTIGALLGGLSVWLAWVLLGRIGTEVRARLGLTVAWAFGSELFWIAGTGGQHLAPQAASACALLAALVLASTRSSPLLAGLILGLGGLARVPVFLAFPLLLWLYRPGAASLADDAAATADMPSGPDGEPAMDALPAGRSRALAPLAALIAGVAIPAAGLAAYAWARFGSPFELGYGLIRNAAGESVLDEPWYEHGIIALDYLPQGLHSMLFRGPDLLDGPPWFVGSLMGTSILLTMPVLWWIANARGRTALAAFLVAWLVMLPNLLHGNPGFAQAGYRFIVDALPILWLLLGLAFRHGMSRAAWVALGAGIVANAWLFGLEWFGIGRAIVR